MSRLRKWLLATAVVTALPLLAAEPDDLIASLPETVAACGNEKITRNAAGQLLRRELSPGDPLTPDHLRIRLRNIIAREFYRQELIGLLTAQGFAPSPELAEAMLRKILTPAAAHGGTLRPEVIRQAASDPERQLKLAVLAMLEKTAPERLAPTPAELERAYREDQMRFYLPPLLRREVVTAPATAAGSQALDAVITRTALGEAVADVVRDIPQLTWHLEAAEERTASDWSAPVTDGGRYRIRRTRVIRAAGFLPLEQAAGPLRAEIAEKRAAAELSALMNRIAATRPIRFFF